MHKGDTIPGILVTAFGVIAIILTSVNRQLTFGSATSDGVPGAGFFPILFGAIVTIFGVFLIIRGLRQRGSVQYLEIDEERKINLKMLFFSVVGLVAFFVLWKLTGLFIVCVPILSLYLNWIFGRTWKFNIVYSAVFTVFIYLVFMVAFSIRFTV